MNMPPRWGFSSFGVGNYNDVAPPELKNGRSGDARTAALIQQQIIDPPELQRFEERM